MTGSHYVRYAFEWNLMGKALKEPTPQVTYLRDEVINCLKEVYYSYPEYK